MPQTKSKFIPIFSLSIDFIFLVYAFQISYYLKFGIKTTYLTELGVTLPNDPVYYYVLGLWELLWIFLVLKYNVYEIPRVLYIDKAITKNIKVLIIFIFSSAAILFLFSNYHFSRQFFIVGVALFSINVLAWRVLYIYFIKQRRKKEKEIFPEVVFVGYNEHIKKLLGSVQNNTTYGYKVKGVFTDGKLPEEYQNLNLGRLDEAKSFVKRNDVKEMIISLPETHSNHISELMHLADNNLVRINLIPEFSEYLSQIFSIDYIENIPLLKFRREPLQSLSNRMMKRGFDLFVSTFIIVFVFSWLFPIIALAIKLTSKGPVFFAQERTGRDGNSFMCYKFRSMTVNAESDSKQATKNDARITKVGGFLRKTSMDELPQVFNVFLNNMSLVGPRPHMLKHTEEYGKLVDKFMVRHFAKPGLTGWAQVLGYRGETKTVKDMENRAMADIWYIENWNFMLDIKIMFLTVWMIVFKKEENAF